MSARYLWIRDLQAPYEAGTSPSGLVRWAFNITVRKTPSTEFTKELLQLLEDRGIGVRNETLFETSRASIPTDKASISILETSGRPSLGHQGEVVSFHQPSALVTAWAPTNSAARALIWSAYGVLIGVRNETLSPT